MLIGIGKPENVPAVRSLPFYCLLSIHSPLLPFPPYPPSFFHTYYRPAAQLQFLERVKRKEVVLSGFGHRIYRTTDPRSRIIQKIANDVFAITGKDELLDTALALRDAALADDYFISKKLAPNVDFFSGLIYRALGFPLDFFPVLFAVPRVVGWLAHWRQLMLSKQGVKIWRPRQIYLGEGKRDYIEMEKREKKEGEKGSEPSKVRLLHHSVSLGSNSWKGAIAGLPPDVETSLPRSSIGQAVEAVGAVPAQRVFFSFCFRCTLVRSAVQCRFVVNSGGSSRILLDSTSAASPSDDLSFQGT
jgi:hypothetical protein